MGNFNFDSGYLHLTWAVVLLILEVKGLKSLRRRFLIEAGGEGRNNALAHSLL